MIFNFHNSLERAQNYIRKNIIADADALLVFGAISANFLFFSFDEVRSHHWVPN